MLRWAWHTPVKVQSRARSRNGLIALMSERQASQTTEEREASAGEPEPTMARLVAHIIDDGAKSNVVSGTQRPQEGGVR